MDDDYIVKRVKTNRDNFPVCLQGERLEVNVQRRHGFTSHKHGLTPLPPCFFLQVLTPFDSPALVPFFFLKISCLRVSVYVCAPVCIRCSVYAQNV